MGADGYGILRQDQNTITGLEIDNANPGVGATASRQIRFFEGSTLVAKIASIGSASMTANGGANALQFWNFANGAMVFGTNSTERMRIAADGDISIGSNADQPAQLFIQGSRAGRQAILASHEGPTTTTNTPETPQWDMGMTLGGYNRPAVGALNNGGVVGAYVFALNVGPGSTTYTTGGSFTAGIALPDTSNPHVSGGTEISSVVKNAYGVQVHVQKGPGTIDYGYGVRIGDIEATNGYGLYQEGSDDTNVLRGKVVIGQPIVAPAFVPDPNNALNVNGNVHFNGNVTGTNIRANYQDIAEWVPAVDDLAPGTVVILNPAHRNEVMASVGAYDMTVAGVVSAQPGLSLGIEAPGKEQIATTGRVKVRVDATDKPVRIGDLLVTSDLPGTAMRSEPIDMNGRKFHQPGTILGKALEPLEGGVGEILVLLSMQ